MTLSEQLRQYVPEIRNGCGDIEIAECVALAADELERPTLITDVDRDLYRKGFDCGWDMGAAYGCEDALKQAEPELERELTPDAQLDRDDFVREFGFDGNCTCCISPPCNSCIHPGNPMNQNESDDCWVTPVVSQQLPTDAVRDDVCLESDDAIALVRHYCAPVPAQLAPTMDDALNNIMSELQDDPTAPSDLALRMYRIASAALYSQPFSTVPEQPAVPLSTEAAMRSYDISPPPEFVDYVKRNYSGEVVFNDPEWHALRLWNAAMRFATTDNSGIPVQQAVQATNQAKDAPAISKSMFPSQIEYDAAIAASKEGK